MLVGAFLYKGSRTTILHVIESEEILEKHYFGLTPLSSTYSPPLFAVYFQPQEPEQGWLSQPGLFPTDNTGSPGSVNICTLDAEWEMDPAHAVLCGCRSVDLEGTLEITLAQCSFVWSKCYITTSDKIKGS